MPAVTVPAEFFRGELRVYGDWREALARELLQNAIDAQPTRIDIEVLDTPDGARVVFSDDGHGMTREVLEDVYFALGRTTKTGPESVGGFGRARLLTCFAQRRYTIRTSDLLVTGSGGDYDLTHSDQDVTGCRFEIDTIDDDARRLRWAFESVLSRSTLNIPVYLDGSRSWPMEMPARATRVFRDADERQWAKVYVDPNGIGKVSVRVHGLPMFERWQHAISQNVIVELTPSRSREVLSASRDTLHTVFGDQMDQFISDLALNRRAALAPQADPLDMRVAGGGFLATDSTTAAPVTTDGDTAGEARVSARALSDEENGTVVTVTPANETARVNFQSLAAGRIEQAAHRAAQDAVWGEPSVRPLGFDVYLLADRQDARVRRLMRRWSPHTWTQGKGARQISLLNAWKAAVGAAMDVLVAAHPEIGRVLWTVGWTFDEDTKACHKTVGQGHVLALNPATDDGKTRYRLSQRQSRQELLAVALHEVCHVVASGHDETFAALLTDLFGRVDVAAADRAIREAA